VLGEKVESATGRTSADPLPSDRLKEKFENCARRALSAERTATVYASVQDFDRLADVRALNNAMTAGEASRHVDTPVRV